MVSKGPSSAASCRVLNRNSCGSGSKVGHWNGGCLIMTNAHVAGDKINRIVRVEFHINGDRVARNARVIEAMYSERVTADWALLFCEDPMPAVPAVPMTKKMVKRGQDLYTRGCPRCVWPPRDSDVDITNVRTDGGVTWWNPNSIGGQSGSGVWDDADNLMYCLLTWSWMNQGRMRGAGQPTAYIYQQQKTVKQTGQFVGHKRPDGLMLPPLPEDFAADWDQEGLSDPELTTDDLFVTQTGIQDYPIWAEDIVQPGPEPDPDEPGEPHPPSNGELVDAQIEFHRKQSELHEKQVLVLQGLPTNIVKPSPDDSGDTTTGGTFGL